MAEKFLRRHFILLNSLWSPIRHHMNDEIGVGWIIGLEMDGIVVLSIHPRVHHEHTRFNCSAFTGLESHRTDG